MRKFLKICYKLNIFISLLLMIYSALTFIASTLNIEFLLHYVVVVQDFATLGIAEWMSEPLYICSASFFCFFINQYFYRVSLTLFNFDKFREITGLFVIPIFAIGQLFANLFILGLISIVPFVMNIASCLILILVQKSNKKIFQESELAKSDVVFDPAMQEMSLKIGQLRILKSEGKISEEEFLFHLNNILENKE